MSFFLFLHEGGIVSKYVSCTAVLIFSLATLYTGLSGKISLHDNIAVNNSQNYTESIFLLLFSDSSIQAEGDLVRFG